MFTVKQYAGLFRQVFLLAVFGVLACNTASAVTEQAVDYSSAELEELVGAVALYPDDLIAIILPASSYPLQIVEAARYLEEIEKNPDLKPDDDWDDSVVALLNYPEVIALLNEDLDWTWNLGEAVVNQQAAVLDAIQAFRGRAMAAGNLKTDDRQTVSQIDDVIEVTPVDPEVIYVPYYEPRRVVVYQPRPVYYYYPEPYPVYYYPYPAYYGFSSGFFWGVTTAYTIGWLTDRVHFHYYGYASHPYYGRHYTNHYYARHAGRVRHRHFARSSRRDFDNHRPRYDRHRYGNTWKPGHRYGDRPYVNQLGANQLGVNQPRNNRFRDDQRRHRRARTDRHQSIASNVADSAGRHRRAGDERIRTDGDRQTRARLRSDQNRKSARLRDTRNRSKSTANKSTSRGNRRRQAGDARTKSRVAVLNRSGSRNPSQRNRKANSRSSSNRAIVRQSERPASASRRTETHAQARQERRQERHQAQDTKRSKPQSRSNAKSATASPNRSANASHGTRLAEAPF